MVSCWNRSHTPFEIEVGARIAQLLFVPIVRTVFQIVDSFEETHRGTGGFGHTGTG